MHAITQHRVPGLNEPLKVNAMDAPEYGANHHYQVRVVGAMAPIEIPFQQGTVVEEGYNGLTNEVVLAIVADRLRGFNSGQFSCRENALALTHTEEALHWLQARTRDRVERGVEGRYVS